MLAAIQEAAMVVPSGMHIVRTADIQPTTDTVANSVDARSAFHMLYSDRGNTPTRHGVFGSSLRIMAGVPYILGLPIL